MVLVQCVCDFSFLSFRFVVQFYMNCLSNWNLRFKACTACGRSIRRLLELRISQGLSRTVDVTEPGVLCVYASTKQYLCR